MEKLTADPATIPGTSHFRGGISNFGLMIWAVSGAVLLLAGLTLARGARVDRRWPAFLTVTGVGVLLLGIDDAYLIHEDVIPHRFGIDEKAVYVVYAALLATYAARFLREIWATNVAVLGVAALSLSLSVGLDAVTHLDGAEEYFKYAGLVCLGFWSVMTAAEALVPRRSPIADASA